MSSQQSHYKSVTALRVGDKARDLNNEHTQQSHYKSVTALRVGDKARDLNNEQSAEPL